MTEKTPFRELSIEEQIASLGDCLSEILSQYELGDFTTESINHEYNSTFKVSCGDGRVFALRINVNSQRSIENLNAEIAWIGSIETVKVPKPIRNRDGSAVSFGWHEATGRKLPAVMYSWLDGEEPGDEPTAAQLFAMGEAMAKLHEEAASLQLPSDAFLPDYTDIFWGATDNLTGPTSKLSEIDQATISNVLAEIKTVIKELLVDSVVQPIHADIHPWNVMWHKSQLAVFDFDDSGIGLPVQDLATSLYYLDTPEQDAEFLRGYASVRPVPAHSERQLALLLLQRRLLLLNYLLETSNPEHAALVPKYKAETLRRLDHFEKSYQR